MARGRYKVLENDQLVYEEILEEVVYDEKGKVIYDENGKFVYKDVKENISDFNLIPDGLRRGELKARLSLEMAMRDHWVKSKQWLQHLNNKRKLGDDDHEKIEDKIPTWKEGLDI